MCLWKVDIKASQNYLKFLHLFILLHESRKPFLLLWQMRGGRWVILTHSPVLQPVSEIGSRLSELNRERSARDLPPIYLHTDAAQAVGKIPVDVDLLKVHYLTIVGHKVFFRCAFLVKCEPSHVSSTFCRAVLRTSDRSPVCQRGSPAAHVLWRRTGEEYQAWVGDLII